MAAIRARGRDSARTSMPWRVGTPDSPHAGKPAGLTTDAPWLALNPDFDQIIAEQPRADVDSVVHRYRQLFQLRRQHPVGVHGPTMPLLIEYPQIAAHGRVWQGRQLLVVCNYSAEAPQFAVQVPDLPGLPNVPDVPALPGRA